MHLLFDVDIDIADLKATPYQALNFVLYCYKSETEMMSKAISSHTDA